MNFNFFNWQEFSFFKTCITLYSLVFFSTCTAQTLQQVFPLLQNERTTTYIPPLNQQAKSELGDTMLESFWTVTGKRLAVKDEAKCDIRGLPGSFLIPKDSEINQIKDDQTGFYFSLPSLMLTVMGGPPGKISNNNVQLFISKTPPHQAKLIHTHLFGTEESKCNISVGYIDFKIGGFDELKKQMIYTGISKGVISVTYREFKNDMARPAFTQDLKFDLSEGRTIGFKGSRFNIIEANNTEIIYEVLKPIQ
jgi:hypothetical protein